MGGLVKYRLARISFSRQALLLGGGLSLGLMNELLSFLPSDSSICGFGSDPCTFEDYIFITSSLFKEADQGQSIPNCYVLINRDSSGDCHIDRIDFSNAIEDRANCTHAWKRYQGFSSFNEECTVCGVTK
jgi:hypothetical protein